MAVSVGFIGLGNMGNPKELHVPVSFANVAQRCQQAALAAGLGEKDTSVIFTLIERLAALSPEQPYINP